MTDSTNPPLSALRRAVSRAIANGAPVYTNQPAAPVVLILESVTPGYFAIYVDGACVMDGFDSVPLARAWAERKGYYR